MDAIKVNSTVKHRHRTKYPLGKVIRIEEGCNPIYWVDFGHKFNGKVDLTVCSKFDIDLVTSNF